MMARRMVYLVLFAFFAWFALSTRKHADWFPFYTAKYGGDTFWATQFLLLLRSIFPNVKLPKLALWNFSFGVVIEISQLYHAPWIDALRHTLFGKLILGFGFMWSDIVCYTIGTLIAFVICIFTDKFTYEREKIKVFSQY